MSRYTSREYGYPARLCRSMRKLRVEIDPSRRPSYIQRLFCSTLESPPTLHRHLVLISNTAIFKKTMIPQHLGRFTTSVPCSRFLWKRVYRLSRHPLRVPPIDPNVPVHTRCHRPGVLLGRQRLLELVLQLGLCENDGFYRPIPISFSHPFSTKTQNSNESRIMKQQ